VRPPTYDGERKAVGDGLAQDREVGPDAVALGRAADRHPKRRLDLVEHEHRAYARRLRTHHHEHDEDEDGEEGRVLVDLDEILEDAPPEVQEIVALSVPLSDLLQVDEDPTFLSILVLVV